ncbi:hypothetical protein PILCRDRAFT_16095 [Piloderma croceum F 1598]|uniref:Uncharacterized protein n=1 Tax=Piloderma croceum (strain F 1598) TaxID=765440 RepID=A0A0C3AFA9_PILCF|nr:hypothetical protein PILCRDRAFT_16095 [Piloderma croceum F 1598]
MTSSVANIFDSSVNSDIRQVRIDIHRMGDNKYYAGRSAVFKERIKGLLIVKLYVDG